MTKKTKPDPDISPFTADQIDYFCALGRSLGPDASRLARVVEMLDPQLYDQIAKFISLDPEAAVYLLANVIGTAIKERHIGGVDRGRITISCSGILMNNAYGSPKPQS